MISDATFISPHVLGVEVFPRLTQLGMNGTEAVEETRAGGRHTLHAPWLAEH